jgi:hypothetical protein
MPKTSLKISKKNIERAVKVSSALEGLSLARAKKNTAVIKLLKKHGRAFSI